MPGEVQSSDHHHQLISRGPFEGGKPNLHKVEKSTQVLQRDEKKEGQSRESQEYAVVSRRCACASLQRVNLNVDR